MKIRAQYHIRTVGDEKWIWDVRKLIEMSQSLPVEEVGLSSISEYWENYWYGEDQDIPTCKSVAEHAQLINDACLDYPIILSPDGRIMDGMHRVCKAHIQGLKKIKARKLKAVPEPDYKNVSLDDLDYDD